MIVLEYSSDSAFRIAFRRAESLARILKSATTEGDDVITYNLGLKNKGVKFLIVHRLGHSMSSFRLREHENQYLLEQVHKLQLLLCFQNRILQ